jgi:hypothetical protein
VLQILCKGKNRDKCLQKKKDTVAAAEDEFPAEPLTMELLAALTGERT